MFEAYQQDEVVSKIPLEATAIASYVRNEKLLIGSRQGHLLSCNPSPDGRRTFEYQVSRTFQRRPIIELQVVDSHNLVLCLTDSQLSVHDAFEPYKNVHNLVKLKPISTFSHMVIEKENLLYVAISARKKLHLFKWLLDELEEVATLAHIHLADNAQQIIWCNPRTIVLSLKSECQLLRLPVYRGERKNTGEKEALCVHEQLPVGPPAQQSGGDIAPLVVYLPDKEHIGVLRGERTVDFFDVQSAQASAEMSSCKFSDAPTAIAYDRPFLMGTLAKNVVEIRSVQPPMLIQKIVLAGGSSMFGNSTFLSTFMLCPGKRGQIYVATETQAWILSSENRIQKNIQFLIEEKHFELAAQLAECSTQQVSQDQLRNIKRQMAANYFAQRKFTKCFEIHADLQTDVLLVINFFPFLIPDKYVALVSRYPQTELQAFEVSLDQIPENERKLGVQALVQHLSARRAEHARLVKLHYLDYREKRTEHILATNVLKRHEAMLELIDTVLLKCYLQVNRTLVASLLRIKNCCCIVSEAERDLNEHKMYEELLMLYERKKMHRKCLELLQREYRKAESPQFGIKRLADFLGRLKADQFNMIREFAPLVLAEDPELGVRIFTSSEEHTEGAKRSDAKNFDRETVLQFLKEECVSAIVPYLEHLIYVWHDDQPKFHEELLVQYFVRVRDLMAQYCESLTSSNKLAAVAKIGEEDELTVYRRKLQTFLEVDKQHTIENAEKLIGNDENLLEEHAIILGRMGKHRDALLIYTTTPLLNFAAAERHCELYYDEKNAKTRNLFNNLFHFYVTGTMLDEKGQEKQQSPTATGNEEQEKQAQKRPNVTEALRLFRRHPTQIDSAFAFGLIPLDTPFSRIAEAVKALFESSNNQLTQSQLVRSLNGLTIERTERQLKELKRQKMQITERVECQICKKRIMNSAFVRQRDHSISHFFCYKGLVEKQQQR